MSVTPSDSQFVELHPPLLLSLKIRQSDRTAAIQ
jgi:hypothetical protein